MEFIIYLFISINDMHRSSVNCFVKSVQMRLIASPVLEVLQICIANIYTYNIFLYLTQPQDLCYWNSEATSVVQPGHQ